jgi:hypothetical protein
VAAGVACAQALELLFPSQYDLTAIEAYKKSFKEIVYAHFGDDIPFMSSTEPWPMTVAFAIFDERIEDGSGDPASMNSPMLDFEIFKSGIKVCVIRACTNTELLLHERLRSDSR